MSKAQQTSLNHSLAGLTSVPQSPKEEEDRARALLDLSTSLIDSALDILDHHIKSDRELVHESELMPGGTPGKHFRHVSVLGSASISSSGARELCYTLQSLAQFAHEIVSKWQYHSQRLAWCHC